jgi:DNA-binding protein H-NS
MATYLELKQQAEALMQQAEQARKQELAQAVEQVRKIMSDYGLSMQDIAGTTAKTRGKAAVKYRGPNGQAWSGRGRKPGWLTQALKDGRTLGDFAV